VNASTGGAMIHLLTLGIPGSVATAVMMGAVLVHGIQPGPLLFTKQPKQVFTLFAGMILANVLMVAFGVLAAMCFATLMRVPAPILNTLIVVFCFIGAFALRNDMADVLLTMLFGVIRWCSRRRSGGFGAVETSVEGSSAPPPPAPASTACPSRRTASPPS